MLRTRKKSPITGKTSGKTPEISVEKQDKKSQLRKRKNATIPSNHPLVSLSRRSPFVHLNYPRLITSLSPCRAEVFRQIFDRTPQRSVVLRWEKGTFLGQKGKPNGDHSGRFFLLPIMFLGTLWCFLVSFMNFW